MTESGGIPRVVASALTTPTSIPIASFTLTAECANKQVREYPLTPSVPYPQQPLTLSPLKPLLNQYPVRSVSPY